MFSGPFYNEIIRYNFYYILFLFLICALLIFHNWKIFRKYFRKVTKIKWCLLFLIVISGCLIRIALNHEPHWSNEPEWLHKANAKFFVNNGKFDFVNPPQGHTFLLVCSYLIFGSNDVSTLILNIVAAGLTIFILFALTYILTKKSNLALIASFFLSIMPTHIYLSGTGENEITSILFVLTYIFFVIDRKSVV